METAAFIISIVALLGSGFSLFLQKKAHERENRREERDTKKSIKAKAFYRKISIFDGPVILNFDSSELPPTVKGAEIEIEIKNIGNVNFFPEKMELLGPIEKKILDLTDHYGAKFQNIKPGQIDKFKCFVKFTEEISESTFKEKQFSIRICDVENTPFLIKSIQSF